MQNKYRATEDLVLVREMLGFTQDQMADALEVSPAAISRWESGARSMSESQIERFYSFVFSLGIDLNHIKEQFYKEDFEHGDSAVVFHGAKTEIQGSIRIDASKKNNDFGRGFYCGESMDQSALFVSNFEKSSVYIVQFNTNNLTSLHYKVNRDWMLTIAYFRGRLPDFSSSRRISSLVKKLEGIDYIVAPIADNRMYQIIEEYIDGSITDEQCKHALAATNLGMQYVIRSEKAVSQVRVLERRYVCAAERNAYKQEREREKKVSEDKIRAARIQYRGKGKYIDEVL